MDTSDRPVKTSAASPVDRTKASTMEALEAKEASLLKEMNRELELLKELTKKVKV